MVITIDTNVIFQALYSSSGASNKILNLVLEKKLFLAMSIPIYFEYYDVLTRKENLNALDLKIDEVEDILDLLVLNAKKKMIYFLLRPNLLDEKDNIFVECAFASNSSFLITSNIKDFRHGELKGFGFEIITPSDFLKLWRNNYGKEK
jgi:putative PIN family toxin of toxin-antitoxin system